MNPYAPPASDVVAAAATGGVTVLASRGARLGGALIDSFAGMAIILPLQFAMGVYRDFPKMRLSPVQTVVWAAFSFGVWVVIHGYFIANGSQTLGKRLLGTQMVNVSDGRPAPFGTVVLLRYLPFSVAAVIPYVGSAVGLVNALLIFRRDRRCAHDHLAGTRVIVKPFG